MADGRLALEFAQKSLDANPGCSIALTMDGWANVYAHKRFDIASERFTLAVEMNPSNSLAWLLKGVTHAFAFEGGAAAEAAERAVRLSPLDPVAATITHWLPLRNSWQGDLNLLSNSQLGPCAQIACTRQRSGR